MTLASGFLAVILLAMPIAAAHGHFSVLVGQQPAAAEKPAESCGQNSAGEQSPASPSETPASQTPPAAAPAAPAKKAATTVHRKRKKKVAPANCAPAAGTAAAGSDAKSAETAKPCPPPKVIVRQGGSAEPAIQLGGGARGDQAAHQRDTTKRMLSATEMNLKKLEGKQLTASQQDMVNQVRQFMQQAKSAVAAGDTERGRTLAWKAQLLSEEVAK